MTRSWLVTLRRYAVAGGMFMALGCAGVLQHTPGSTAADGGSVPTQLQSRQVIVILAPTTPERWGSLDQPIAQAYDLSQVGAFPLLSLGVQCLVFQIPEGRAVDEVMARLAADPRVALVQPNQVFQGLHAAHNDPYATLQYGARAIRADLAHRWATGHGVKVAVVDTGVDTKHPDLHGRIIRTINFVEGGERTFARDSHGTAVAGVIAATADNEVGIFGIAPQADIVVVKACWQPAPGTQEAVCSSWTLAKAIDFTILVRAQIPNLSLSGPPDPLLARLLAKAVAGGITVVAAALEEGEQAPGLPASLEAVIAVVASDPQGRVRGTAGMKRTPLLAAPGIEILTIAPRQAYDFLSGSSLAAAHISGIAALLLEVEPRLSPAQVYALLRASTPPIEVESGTPQAAIGLVDACTAVARLLGQPACP